MRYFKRALHDTLQGQARALFVLIVGGIIGLGYLWYDQGKPEAKAEVPYWEAAVFGSIGSLVLLFFWNLACSPYRLERDAHVKTRQELERIEPDGIRLSEFVKSRTFFTLKEAACLKARTPITNDAVTGAASGYLHDLKKKVLSGELRAHGMPDPILIPALQFRLQNRNHWPVPLSKEQSEALENSEVSKSDLFRIGFINEGSIAQWQKET